MADYIPRPDGDFVIWEVNFCTYANAHLVDLGLIAADMTAINTARTAFDAAYAAHNAAQIAAQTARELKQVNRETLESAIRALVRRLQASPKVSDDERRALGITIPDDVQSPATPAGVDTSRPVAQVSTAQRLRHEVKFYDEATPTSRARPKGAMGCEIWVKIGGPPPTDAGDCVFAALDTASPYVAEYGGAQAGQVAYYMLRWVNTRGDKGPWSETVAATIGA